MATIHLSDQLLRQIPLPCVTFRLKTTSTSLPVVRHVQNRRSLTNNRNSKKWTVKSSLVEEVPQKSVTDLKGMVDFLYEDLPHLFDDQGIDRTAYDELVRFRDPITKHDRISGYLFNISLLKILFRPDFKLHWAKQTAYAHLWVKMYHFKRVLFKVEIPLF